MPAKHPPRHRRPDTGLTHHKYNRHPGRNDMLEIGDGEDIPLAHIEPPGALFQYLAA